MLQIKNTLGGGKPEGLYAWKKLSAQGGDFIDYVVSDKETAYPDGGEKGGYWYERVVEGLTPEMFGCTKMAVDTFTPTSDIRDTNWSIPHSLGEIPKLIFIIGKNVTHVNYGTGSYIVIYDIITNVNAGTSGVRSRVCGKGYDYSGSIKNISNSSSDTRKFSSTNILECTGNQMHYLRSGAEYQIITMA